MDAKQLKFALASRRFFQGAQWIARIPVEQVRLSRRWGRWASPYVADFEELVQSYSQAFHATPEVASSLAHQWLASHGLFGVSIFSYERAGPDWVRERVHVDHPEVLQSLRQQVRSQAASSPLFDAPRFARDWWAAIQGLWRQKMSA